MTRRLLNLLTALSLLLCVAVVGVGVQSYFGSAGFYYRTQARYVELAWLDGWLYCSDVFGPDTVDLQSQWGRHRGFGGFWNVGSPGRPNLVNEVRRLDPAEFSLSFRGALAAGPILSFNVVRVPCAAVAFGLAVQPAVWAWTMRRGVGRRTSGVCSRCSYDLTGNVSGVCPECGQQETRVAP